MRRFVNMKRAANVLAVLFAAFLLPACATKPAAPKPALLTDQQRELEVESFDHVWTTIKDHHWDPNLNGVDWEAAKTELRPQVEAARTAPEARAAMTRLIGKLGQSHFGIVPAEAYEVMKAPDSAAGAAADKEKGTGSDKAKPPAGSAGSPGSAGESAADKAAKADADEMEARAGVGLTIRPLNGEGAVVAAVDPDSPAAKAGVKPGWVITKVDDMAAGVIIGRITEAMKDHPSQTVIAISRSIEHRLDGPAGTEVRAEFLDGEDHARALTLTRAVKPGRVARLGNLPPQIVRYESRWLNGGIMYITFNIFLDPTYLMKEYSATMQQSGNARGMILDLRGNPGGIGGLSMGIGGWLVDKPNQRLGTMITRESKLNFVLNPRAGSYPGPLAVLVDECSASTTEILAGGLQDLKRARVFGTRTMGAALPSVIEKLPSGDGFQYAFANYISVGGEALEGRGVTPDQVVPLTRAELLAGRDPVIEAAAAWIREQARTP